MRICIFTDPFPAWSQTFIYDEISGLKKFGHEIRIISLFKKWFIAHPILKKIKEIKTHYLSQYDLSFGASPFSKYRLIRMPKYLIKNAVDNKFRLFTTRSLLALVKAEKPDLFLIHFGALGEKFLWLKKEFDIPYVVFFHGCELNTIQRKRYNDYAESFRRADRFLVKSDYMRKKMVELGCKPEKISVIPFGINPEHYHVEQREKNNEFSKIKLIGVGRLVRYKDFLSALDVISKCIRVCPSLQYDIIGDGPLKRELLNKIRTLGLSNICFLRGAKSTEEVNKYMNAADIYLQPACYDKYGETEAFGNSFLEAGLYGLPVASSRVGGISETVIHNETGFLAPERDTKTTTEYLLELIKNKEKRKIMGKKARINVIQNFDSRKRIIELNQLLETFLRGPGANV